MSAVALLLVPALLLPWMLRRGQLVGPFYEASRLDPSYAYLESSAVLGSGGPPLLLLHPAATVQLVGALVVSGVHAWSGSGSVAEDVVLRPEHYLSRIHLTLLLLLATSVAAAGYVLWRAGVPLGLVVLFQLATLAVDEPQQDSIKVAAEVLMWGLGTLLGAMGVAAGMRPGPHPRLALAAGATFGLGLASKLTFAGLVVFLLAAFPDRRDLRRWLAGAAASFVLTLLPFSSAIPQFASFVSDLVRQQSLCWQPATDLTGWLGRVARLAGWLGRTDWPWLVCLLVAVLSLTLVGRPTPAGQSRVLAGILVTALVQVLLVARDPLAPVRYLVPAMALFPALVVLLVLAVWSRWGVRLAIATGLGLTLLLGHGAWCLWPRVVPGPSWVGVARLAARARGLRDCPLVEHFRSPSVEFALFSGGRWVGGGLDALLARRYPGRFFYRGGFSTFAGPTTLPQLAPQHCAYLLGFAEYELPAWPAGSRIETIDQWGRLRVARVEWPATP